MPKCSKRKREENPKDARVLVNKLFFHAKIVRERQRLGDCLTMA